ncbi:MAG: hypothetical protein HXS46_17085 [Theionarchaea archaeon]|nr:hypothetical protein [Theionarchaea archaeon]
MDSETLEKVPQLKKVKGHLVKVYPEKVRAPPEELAKVMYTVKYTVDYTVWDNYIVAV